MASNGNPAVNLETRNHSSGVEGERVEVQGVDEREMSYRTYVGRQIYLQEQLFVDEENDSFEIKQKKRMARTALTMWTEDDESLKQQILRGDSEMRSIMNEVYNLVGLYSVFVGVVFTAVVTSNSLECRHLWSPVGLSLFAYFMLVVVAFKKFKDIHDLVWTKKFNVRFTMDIQRWILKLRRVGYADFDFNRDYPDGFHHEFPPPFWRNALSLIVPLTIFTTGIVFSFIHILCWS